MPAEGAAGYWFYPVETVAREERIGGRISFGPDDVRIPSRLVSFDLGALGKVEPAAIGQAVGGWSELVVRGNKSSALDEYTVGPGDAITFDSTTPHRLSNEGTSLTQPRSRRSST